MPFGLTQAQLRQRIANLEKQKDFAEKVSRENKYLLRYAPTDATAEDLAKLNREIDEAEQNIHFLKVQIEEYSKELE